MMLCIFWMCAVVSFGRDGVEFHLRSQIWRWRSNVRVADTIVSEMFSLSAESRIAM